MDNKLTAWKKYLEDLRATATSDFTQGLASKEVSEPVDPNVIAKINRAWQIFAFSLKLMNELIYDILRIGEKSLPEEFKMGAKELWGAIRNIPPHIMLRAICYIDNDNAAIQEELISSIEGGNYEEFCKIIKDNRLNTSKISRFTYAFVNLSGANADGIDISNKLDAMCLHDQQWETVNALIQSNKSSEINKDVIAKLSWAIGMDSNQYPDISILEFYNIVETKLNFQPECEDTAINYDQWADELILCALKYYIVTLGDVNFPESLNLIIDEAINYWKLRDEYDKLTDEYRKKFVTRISDTTYEATHGFNIPDDFFDNEKYPISSDINHFIITKKFETQCTPKDGKSALTKLVNILAESNCIFPTTKAKVQFLYLLTGRLMDKSVDIDDQFNWRGKAVIAFHIIKNAANGQKYDKAMKLIKFPRDSEGFNKLSEQYKQNASELASRIDILPKDEYENYKSFVYSEFGWTYKGKKK